MDVGLCNNLPLYVVSAETLSAFKWQELIRRWDSERELLRSAPGSYPNSLK